ncbi:MAG: hypothetical protein ACJA0I_002077 [Gammaproteobacteria bacterium]|jgi:hypothetical protein
MISKHLLVALTVSSLFVTGCATVKLSESGEKVRVLGPEEVSTCNKLGQSNVSITAKVLGIARPIETLTKELELIARGSAANMGGDTIVPLTVIDDGKQSFVVYKCVAPEG